MQLLSAVGVPAALAIAVGNGFWQAQLQRRQLKHSLFEKRFTVYYAVREFLGEITRTLRVDDLQRCFKFLRDTNQAEFLFDPSVESFISEVYRMATSLHTVNAVLDGGDVQDNQAQLERQRELEMWLSEDAHNIAASTFRPYLILYDKPSTLGSIISQLRRKTRSASS